MTVEITIEELRAQYPGIPDKDLEFIRQEKMARMARGGPRDEYVSRKEAERRSLESYGE